MADRGDSDSEDVSVRGEPGSLEDRRLTHEAWDRVVEIIETTGMPARLELDPMPEDPYAYEPDASEWVEDEHHEEGGYYRDRAVLLSVRVVPISFPRLANRPRRHGEAPYHISLCYTTELHRFDLTNRRQGVRRGSEVYQTLRRRYHGRAAVLRGRVRGSALVLNGRTLVEGASNIFRDGEVHALHDCGRFHNRPLHVSL